MSQNTVNLAVDAVGRGAQGQSKFDCPAECSKRPFKRLRASENHN